MDSAITYKIILADFTKRKIKGTQLTEHFATFFERGKGWSIIHLPSGRALVLCSLRDLDDAKRFAVGFEKVFGDELDQFDENKPRDGLQLELCKLIRRLNKTPNATYSLKEIESIYDHLG